MSITKAAELRQRAKSLWETAKKDKNDAYASERGFDGEAEEKFDKAMADLDDLKARYEKLEEIEAKESRLSDWFEEMEDREQTTTRASAAEAGESRTAEAPKVDISDATSRWMRLGHGGLKPEERQVLGAGQTKVDNLEEDWGQDSGPSITIPFDQMKRDLYTQMKEQRAQSVGTATAGQEFVPEGFWPNLTAALLWFGGATETSRVITTPTGNDLPFPTFDDTGNSGALLAENTQDAEQDIATAETVLNAYKYTSKIIRVSKELEQDSFFAITPWIGDALGTRLARIRNNAATVGTGSSQPNGFVTAASDSTVTTTNATTFATRANILDLIGSVDLAYRRGSNVRHTFSPDSEIRIRKMEDANNLPLYDISTRVGAPSTIEGYPFTLNEDVADLATTAKFWVFGDFSYFIIRMVLGITLVRLVERYADFHQVGYVAIMRFDSDLVDGGGGAIKWMDAGV